MYNKKFNVTNDLVFGNRVRGLKSEYGEAQAKWGGFKYWATKQKYTRDEILEECIDMLHFYLSIGNYLKVPTEHHYIDRNENQLAHLDAMDFALLNVHTPMGWYMSFALFRGMLINWGFDWENDVLRMYDEKNKVNYERQEHGY